MRFDSVVAWSGHYLATLERKLMPARDGECKIWTGGPREGLYGKMKVYVPELGTIGGPWSQKTVTVHRLAYMLNIPAFNIQPADHEVSHICHQPRCCKFEHLSFEPHAINVQRNTCKAEGKCSGHGQYKSCINI